MGKKFITLINRAKTYRLYTQDIRIVHQKIVRKTPCIPPFVNECKPDEEETEQSYACCDLTIQGYKQL